MRETRVELEKFQSDFIFSKYQYPVFVGGWATGKTMSAIYRALLYTKGIPNNLGVIFRKTFRSLADSTLKDFEKYTGLKVPADRSLTYPNGSTILFRHLDEIDSINQQNINLGWFYIEQGEELESDREFFMLFGRVRRDVKPTKEFLELGLPFRSGWVIANAGDNWIKRVFKDSELRDKDGKVISQLIEATTFDNTRHLPEDFLSNLKVVEQKRPDIYRQYVLNDWEAQAETVVFKGVGKCIYGELEEPIPGRRYIFGIDLAKSQDYTVIIGFDAYTKHLVYFKRITQENWSLQKRRIILACKQYNDAEVVIDATGVGDPILEDLIRAGVRATPFKFTAQSKEDLIERLLVAIEGRRITFPDIPELIDELKGFVIDKKPTGRITYKHTTDHDDCVMALGLAVWQLDIYSQVKKEEQELSPFWQRVKKDISRAKKQEYEDIPEEEFADVI